MLRMRMFCAAMADELGEGGGERGVLCCAHIQRKGKSVQLHSIGNHAVRWQEAERFTGRSAVNEKQ